MNSGKLFEQYAIQMLKESGIEAKKTGNLYYGHRKFIMPTLVDDGIYHFKFFLNPEDEYIESEVEIVEYLRKNGISVPEFYEKDGKNIFHSSESIPFRATFFASKHIDADPDQEYSMSKEASEDIIKHIGEMHLKLRDFDKSKITLDHITDYEKLVELYIFKKDLCDERGLSDMIEKIISFGTDKVDTYPIHSDLHSANIMMENDKFKAFIDFSDVRDSYFEDELGKVFQNLMGSKGYSIEEVKRLIEMYEENIGIKLSRKNVYISTMYRLLDRYFYKLSRGVIDTDYDIKINEILESLAKEIEITEHKKEKVTESEGVEII